MNILKLYMIQVVFEGETTLWEHVEYIFECGRDRVSYFYKVLGNGSLDNARFFEGFLRDDPRLEARVLTDGR